MRPTFQIFFVTSTAKEFAAVDSDSGYVNSSAKGALPVNF